MTLKRSWSDTKITLELPYLLLHNSFSTAQFLSRLVNQQSWQPFDPWSVKLVLETRLFVHLG